MSDEERPTMRTSEITTRLQHRSPAVTRAWISALPEKVKLEVADRDNDTGEKLYYRDEVEAAIEATTQRGPYRTRPTEEPAPDDRNRLGPDDQPH